MTRLRYHDNGGVFFVVEEVAHIAQMGKSDLVSSERVSMLVSEKEQKLIEILREVGYAEVVVVVKGGVPVHLEEIKKSIKL